MERGLVRRPPHHRLQRAAAAARRRPGPGGAGWGQRRARGDVLRPVAALGAERHEPAPGDGSIVAVRGRARSRTWPSGASRSPWASGSGSPPCWPAAAAAGGWPACSSVATALASPVAGVFLALAWAAWLLQRRDASVERAPLVICAALATVPLAACTVAVPRGRCVPVRASAPSPFMVGINVLALALIPREQTVLRVGVFLYLLVCRGRVRRAEPAGREREPARDVHPRAAARRHRAPGAASWRWPCRCCSSGSGAGLRRHLHARTATRRPRPRTTSRWSASCSTSRTSSAGSRSRSPSGTTRRPTSLPSWRWRADGSASSTWIATRSSTRTRSTRSATTSGCSRTACSTWRCRTSPSTSPPSPSATCSCTASPTSHRSGTTPTGRCGRSTAAPGIVTGPAQLVGRDPGGDRRRRHRARSRARPGALDPVLVGGRPGLRQAVGRRMDHARRACPGPRPPPPGLPGRAGPVLTRHLGDLVSGDGDVTQRRGR